MATDYKFPRWFQLSSFTGALTHLEKTASRVQKNYEGTDVFRPVATTIEMLSTSTWCLNRPMMCTLEAMIHHISNEVIPNLRKEKSSLKTDVQGNNTNLDIRLKVHNEKKCAELTSKHQYETFEDVPFLSYISRRKFIRSILKRLRAKQRLYVSRQMSSDTLEELSNTEALIIELNGLVKAMHNLYNKGMEVDVMMDEQA